MPPAKDWHQDLVIAAAARLLIAKNNSHRNEQPWRNALNALKLHQKPIKWGKEHGIDCLKGLPKEISESIKQILIQVARGDLPIQPMETVGADLSDNVADSRIYHDIRYRDCRYGLLAALYRNYQGVQRGMIDTNHLKHSAQKNSTEDFFANFMHTGKHGAWKAKDKMVSDHLVIENKTRNGKSYCLSLDGAKLCYALFTSSTGKFHPNQGPYPEIKPKVGHVDSDGNYFMPAVSSSSSSNTSSSTSSSLDVFSSNDFHSPHRSYGLSSSTSMPHPALSGVSQKKSPLPLPLPLPGSTSSSYEAKFPESAETIRWKRLLVLDPTSERKFKKVMEEVHGVTEEQAWQLVQQGAADEPKSIKTEKHSNSAYMDAEAIDHMISSNMCATEEEATSLLESFPELYDQVKFAASSTKKEHVTSSTKPMAAARSSLRRIDGDFEDVIDIVTLDDSQNSDCQVIEDMNSVIDVTPFRTQRSGFNRELITLNDFRDSDIQILYDEEITATPSKKKKKIGGEIECFNLTDLTRNNFTSSSDADIYSKPNSHLFSNVQANNSLLILQQIERAKEISESGTEEVTESGDVLTFFMCEHERGSQGYYRQFAYSCKDKIAERFRDVESVVGHIHLGDFMWIICKNEKTGDNVFKGADKDDDANLFTGVVIERKCLNDIITGSADINKSIMSKEYLLEEARHYRQERNLRFSKAKFPIMLVEGEFWTAHGMKARVSSHRGNKDLERPDAMCEENKTADLMRYICGIICRNFGKNIVYPVITPSTASSTLLFVVITDVIKSHMTSYDQNRPTYPKLKFHLENAKKINERRKEFLKSLKDLICSEDVIGRVSRRFSDMNSLLSAYSICKTEKNASKLLSDLSYGGSNMDSPKFQFDLNPHEILELKQSSESIWAKVQQEGERDNRIVTSRSSSSLSSASFATLPNRKTMVLAFNGMQKIVDNQFDKVSIIPKEDTSAISWASVVTSSDERSSTPLVIIVLSGVEIVELWAKAFDMLEDLATKEIDVVRVAFQLIESSYSPDLNEAIDETKSEGGQIVILIDNLGTGSGIKGAVGKLQRLHSTSTRQQPGTAPSPAATQICMGEDREYFSIHASQYITMKASYMVHCFTTIGVFEHQYQIIPTSGGDELSDYTSILIQEHNRLSLLTFS